MTNYSLSEIKSMQEEAARRVREMNARSKRTVETTNRLYMPQPRQQPGPHGNSPLPQTQTTSSASQSDCAAASGGHSGFGQNLIKSLNLQSLLGKNSDQTLILLVLLLLITDNDCDELLILALLYIML